MNRTFIEVPMFTKKWHELGLTDDDFTKMREVEEEIIENSMDNLVEEAKN